MTRRTLAILGVLPIVLACAVAAAQAPKAVITGPREARCGALVVLDASESIGMGRLWLLAASPEETSFLPVEQALKCIMASPTPGAYRFVLIVSGTDSAGGPAADMATHTVVLRGAEVPPPPPPDEPTDPTKPPPQPQATAVTYIYEKDQHNPPRAVQAALDRLNAAGSGIVASVFEQDTTSGTGQVPAQYRAQLQAAKSAGLPCLVVVAGDQVLRVVKDPKTADEVLEALK
jgi:hypothetical protein